MKPRRIVFAAMGSHGDLHPALAVAETLRSRGHSVVVATDPTYREKVEKAGVEFARLRPGRAEHDRTPGLFEKINQERAGTEFILRTLVVPYLRESAEDLDAAAEGADLLVSHPLAFVLPAVAEKRKIPWVGTSLQPILFMSAYDPSVLPQAPWLDRLRSAGPWLFRPLRALGSAYSAPWLRPVVAFRRSWGLPDGPHPLFGGQFSPHLNLALFSAVLAAPQPDWPEGTVVTGFPFHDPQGPFEGEADLERFLAGGTPPILFTLGTTAVMDPGAFYQESAAAAAALGERAILLVGAEPRHAPLGRLPESVHVMKYVPFDRLMRRCRAIVHQGGVGTTGQALRSGRPQLIVPWANDQPDNAARVARLGAGLTLARGKYRAGVVENTLRELLRSERIRGSAERAGDAVRAERGTEAAADAIERLF